MPKVELPDSNGGNKSSNGSDDEIEKTSTKMANINKSLKNNSSNTLSNSPTEIKTLFSRYRLHGISNNQLDIDIDYAIHLLKKEDQNINVYSHLKSILDKLLVEKPKNPLETFEEYSHLLKRTYNLNEEYNFERVFVDAINRSDCRKRLHMYKCSLKKQRGKQKHYYDSNTNIKSKSEDTNINDDIEVQNLWDVNHMFNKADCGLPTDEVSLISLTMNKMAQLNKFKSIKFWGKIFGLKCTYFVIECEWTDVELHRKLMMGNYKSKSSGQSDSNLSTMCTEYICNQINKKDSIDSDSIRSSETNANSQITGNSSSDDFSNYSSENNSSQLRSEIPSEIPPEKFGTGTNRNVYFFTNNLNSKWTELDSVQPHNIVEARKIKRYFTGKLYEPLNSFPNFNGLEIDYLRAQIARISSSTSICPKGYYVIDRKGDQSAKLDVRSTISSKSTAIISSNSWKNLKKSVDHKYIEELYLNSDTDNEDEDIDISKLFDYDLTINKNFMVIPSKNLIELHNWVHKNPRIDTTGMTTDKSDFLVGTDSKVNNTDISDEMMYLNEAEEEFDSYAEPSSKTDLFGNLKNDVTNEGMPAWKGVICSQPNARHKCIMMKSNLWPGAYAITYKSKTDFVYIGWAQKQDSSWYSSNLMNEPAIETVPNNDLLEYQIPTGKNVKKILNTNNTQNKKNQLFPIKQNRNAFKGIEKLIKSYTYS
ncbi:Radial spokehead-like protein [Cinara cedri]|uniref:Radial spokehead-like protein n=1 Tax=Cinara cedri TaxID=506608 RepID=A0A5E4MHN7_9HEMI|nr:Radial spokehead-like protein [Cinara cedri]